MRLSRKGIKKLLWLLVVLIFIFVVVRLLVFCNDNSIDNFNNYFVITPSDIAAYTKDELGDLYRDNNDEFVNVAEIMLANDKIRQIIINNYDDDWGLFAKNDKDFFSEEEWNQIEKLFKKIRPYKIMLSLRNNDSVVYFNFNSREVDGKKISTSLYYFKNEKTVEWYKLYGWVGTLEQLDGYWYIGEYIRDK